MQTTNQCEITELSQNEIDQVDGGFVCGGLCIAGAAFAAGALFGAGLVVGYKSAK
jgi:lactobin A/cerein 7B family class IIb bacteriocin